MEKGTLNIEGIAKKLAEEKGITIDAAKKEFTTAINLIKSLMEEGYKLKIVDFGNFYSVLTKARIGRNPRTQTALTIQPRCKLKFEAARKWEKETTEKLRADGTLPSIKLT